MKHCGVRGFEQLNPEIPNELLAQIFNTALDCKDFGSLGRVFSSDPVHVLTCYDGVINQSASILFK